MSASSIEPWLLGFATRARGRVPTEPLPYDAQMQVAVVLDASGAPEPAVLHHPPPQTKKGDIEKQEDQKDRW